MRADRAHVGGLRESLGGKQAGRLCPWPGLPELIWNRRGHAAGWAGRSASGPFGFYPPNHGWSSRVTARWPQLPAVPDGGGEIFPALGGSLHSWSSGSSSLPSALGHALLSSARPLLPHQQESLCGAPEQAGSRRGGLGGGGGARPRAASPEQRPGTASELSSLWLTLLAGGPGSGPASQAAS